MAQQILLEKFLERAQQHPDKIYLNQPIERQLQSYTWSEVEQQARKIAQGLFNQGLSQGDCVAIYSKNCAHWLISDIAIMMAGMISVPIYHTASTETIEYVLAHSESKAMLIGKLDGPQAYNALNNKPLTISMPYDTVACDKSWDDLLKSNPLNDKDMANASSEATFSISYTSGTTGTPKGVELTPNMMMAGGQSYNVAIDAGEKDRALSYLPLAHITERTIVEVGSFIGGCELYFVESLDTFIEDLQAARVTIFLSVPRLWHKFKDNVQEKLPPKKLNKLLSIPLVSSIISSIIRKKLGLNHCHTFGSGTAPIDKETLSWYKAIGINISEGWGMTESAAAGTCNLPYQAEALGTIGRPLDNVTIKISEQGEILIKGPMVFKSYYKNPEATAATFEDGWLKTGDLGKFDSYGNIVINGRIKEQFKTSKGKYVTPTRIENLLVANPLLEQICVFGSGLGQPIAVATLNEGVEKNAANFKNIENTLNLCNAKLEGHERLDHLYIVTDEWSPDTGLITPTLKMIRNKIEEKYKHLGTEEHKDALVWL